MTQTEVIEGLKEGLAARPSRVREICDSVRRLIVNGGLKPGTQLPSEIELADALGVSRNTLREALNVLAHQGTVRRERGAGTFITSHLLMPNRLDINMGVTEFIQSLHKEPGVGQMRVTAQAVDDYWSEQLAVPPQSEVVRVERVRLADGEPIIYSVDVLPMAVLRHQAPGITTEDLKGLLVEHMSIYKILETRLGLTIDHGVAILEPTRADEDVARNLEVDVGSLILLLTQTDYDPASDPIMASQEHHRSDACRFTVYRAR